MKSITNIPAKLLTLSLLATTATIFSAEEPADLGDYPEKCLDQIFDGKLENVTASRSLWTMIADPKNAYFLQSPEYAYIQCLRTSPKSRKLVELGMFEDKSLGVVASATIGNTKIESMDAYGKAQSITQDGISIDPKLIDYDVRKETFKKLAKIHAWQYDLVQQELVEQKVKARPVIDQDFLKNISTKN